MPKSKYAPALFEMMRHDLSEKPELPVAKAKPEVAHEPAPLPDPEISVPADISGGESKVPWIKSQGQKIRFSLDTLTLALAIFCLGVLLFGAFQWGQRVGYRAGLAADQELDNSIDPVIREAQKKPADASLLQGLDQVEKDVTAQQARRERSERSETTGFIDGLNYIWVDTFATREEASAAQQYLQQHQIETVVVEKENKYRLFTTQGFDRRIPEEKSACDQTAEKIKEIGQAYFKAGGRYRFDCLVKLKKPEDSWQRS